MTFIDEHNKDARFMTVLRGTVRSGKGNFSFWLAKLEPYYTQKTGMKLHPGTLNVHLTDAIFPTPNDSIRLEKERIWRASLGEHGPLQDIWQEGFHPPAGHRPRKVR